MSKDASAGANGDLKTIGVILPMLSGFYMGEITATLRELAIRHRFNLVLIRTGHYGDFELPLAINQLDGLMVVLHSAADNLIAQALERDIPVMSIGASYAPLEVEQITSDQSQGITLLYQWLISQGHEQIGFCGDLNINDIRMRFKAYQNQLARHGHDFCTGSLFNVLDASLAGGREAAAQWLARDNPCSAVICATDYNAIGMMEKLTQQGIRVPEDVAVVGIDNIFLGAHNRPQLTSIDQQLQNLTSKATERLLQRIDGEPFDPAIIQIPQTLVVRESCGAPETMRTNPNDFCSVRKELVAHSDRSPAEVFEAIYSQARSGFDSLLNLHGLYNTSMKWACYATASLSRYQISRLSRRGDSYARLLSEAEEGQTPDFPPAQIETARKPQHSIQTIIPVASGEPGQFEVLALVDNLSTGCATRDYAMLNNYLDMLSLFLQRDALLETTRARQQHSQELLSQLQLVSSTSNDGIWDWDLNTNQLNWNSRLVDILALNSAPGQNAFHSENLFNCIHPDDLPGLESSLSEHLLNDAPFNGNFRARRRDGKYLWLQINGASIRDRNNRPVRLIGSVTDITQQKRSVEKIHKMAYYDSLTGVPNRRMVTETLRSKIENQPRKSLAVMMMDLNRFKLVNDSFGHDVGDAVLCHVATRVKSTMRKDDICARLGGDELLFVCEIDHPDQARDIAARILKQAEIPLHYKTLELCSKGSLGIALYPQDATATDELIKKADMAMYQAKQFRSRQLMFYNQDMDGQSHQQISIEQGLIKALDNDELEVWYQPQIDVASGGICGAEALVRWHSPDHGSVSPAEFIPVAEECGLIGRIGNRVLEQVCRDLSSAQLSQYQKVSINVSSHQLSQPSFADEVIQTILSYGLPLEQLCIEITETSVFADFEHAGINLSKLSGAGLGIALDDFGTGYSSLSLLKQLPLTEVKIDRSFIRELVSDSANQTMVSSIIAMSHGYGYKVTAEGIETPEQAQMLAGLNCDNAQGYYYARPRPLSGLPRSGDAPEYEQNKKSEAQP